MVNVAEEVIEKPQNENLTEQPKGKVVNMFFARYRKKCGEIDFRQLLIDCGIRHCPPQRDGLLF